jgi:CRP/FNR family transcriptional regulator
MKRALVVSQNCATCSQRAKTIVCDLADAELATFQRLKQSLRYDGQQTVFYEGHPCLGMYLLCSGKVKLTRSSARGQRQIVRIAEGGDLLEKHVFRDGALHEVTCETLESCHVCFIDRQAYLELVRRNSELAIRLIQLLSSELGIRMDQRDLFAFRSGRERLAALLLELGTRFGEKAGKGTLIGIKLKREELADMAGIAVETAIRLLSAFREEGLIGIDRRSITLLSRDRLARIARI